MTNLLARVFTGSASPREAGATATEYALMMSFIAVVIMVAVISFGAKLSSFFIDAATQV